MGDFLGQFISKDLIKNVTTNKDSFYICFVFDRLLFKRTDVVPGKYSSRLLCNAFHVYWISI